MPTTPHNFKEVRVIVPIEVWQMLEEQRTDSPVRTFQAMLAPLVCAFARGEIKTRIEHIVRP